MVDYYLKHPVCPVVLETILYTLSTIQTADWLVIATFQACANFTVINILR